MKTLKYTKWVAFVSIVICFVSCKVDFSPNGAYQETPVVYCILDQDEDTTYVRVQRCFMGEGNQYVFAANPDSNNYPQGDISVKLEEWRCAKDDAGSYHRVGASPVRVFDFDYTTVDKQDGDFYSSSQPVYVCNTAGMLDTSKRYRLIVIKSATGDTIAQAETMLIYGNLRLMQPNNATKFQFSGSTTNKNCNFVWTTMTNARQYQPSVRFHYRDFIVDNSLPIPDTTIILHYVDIPCNAVKSNMNEVSLSTQLAKTTFLSSLKEQITGQVTRNIIDTVDVSIVCCTEDLAAYMYSTNPSSSINQESFTYSNVKGGIGVFAARRSHIVFRVASASSVTSDYVRSIKELNIGF